MMQEDIKIKLEYVCKNKKGYVNDLIQNVGDQYVSQFESIGFITKGHTLKFGTWKKTRLADRYYKDLFGYASYLFKVRLCF